MIEGKIDRLPAGRDFGFIKPDDGGANVFFHFSQVRDTAPQMGLRVRFEVEQGEKGPRARNLQVIRNQVSPKAEPAAYRFLNPYNFVRYLSGERAVDHVLGVCPPPPHDRYVGLTGRIACMVETVTPLFISDSHAIEATPDGHRMYRFFQVNGEHALPASSLRGMCRSVFEAVTNSCFAIFQKDDPYPLEHREPVAPDMVPARVVRLDGQGALLEVLDCTRGAPVDISGKPSVMMAAAVTRSYPHRVFNSKTGETYNPIQSQLPKDPRDGMRVAALLKQRPATHRLQRFRAFQAVQVVAADKHESLSEDTGLVKVFGWLHLTGPNIENKHDERLFFRWGDRQPDSPEIGQIPGDLLYECTDKVVTEYNYHLSEYWKRAERRVRDLESRGSLNSLNGLPHPSTFVEENRRLRVGDLVYAKMNSRDAVTILRTVCIPRVRYKHGRQELLPGQLARCEKYDLLCPACRVFGWVGKDTAYAGRVRFSHGSLVRSGVELPQTTLAVLSTPKPTATPFYLLNAKGEPDPQVDYDTEKARLRGRKFYHHHGEANSDEYKDNAQGEQNRTIQGALKPGATFRFSVHFESMAELELGALLYALELDGDMVHRLGYAKPLGFGSVKVTLKSVEVLDWLARLRSVDPGAGWRSVDGTRFKEAFAQEIKNLYGEEFDQVLADLRHLFTGPDLPVHYPRSRKHPNKEGCPSYEWFVGNNKRRFKRRPDQVALDLAHNANKGLPLIDKTGDPVP